MTRLNCSEFPFDVCNPSKELEGMSFREADRGLTDMGLERSSKNRRKYVTFTWSHLPEDKAEALITGEVYKTVSGIRHDYRHRYDIATGERIDLPG